MLDYTRHTVLALCLAMSSVACLAPQGEDTSQTEDAYSGGPNRRPIAGQPVQSEADIEAERQRQLAESQRAEVQRNYDALQSELKLLAGSWVSRTTTTEWSFAFDRDTAGGLATTGTMTQEYDEDVTAPSWQYRPNQVPGGTLYTPVLVNQKVGVKRVRVAAPIRVDVNARKLTAYQGNQGETMNYFIVDNLLEVSGGGDTFKMRRKR